MGMEAHAPPCIRHFITLSRNHPASAPLSLAQRTRQSYR
jgi:hypothetical protein